MQYLYVAVIGYFEGTGLVELDAGGEPGFGVEIGLYEMTAAVMGRIDGIAHGIVGVKIPGSQDGEARDA